MDKRDATIAALATPPGIGGIAIVRISGDRAEEFLHKVFKPLKADAPWESHRMLYGKVYDQEEVVDECMAVIMRAPRSYTREDVAELQLHGGEYIAQRVLKLLYSLGAEPALPGEFTRRAFLNGRLDLSRAEAVMSIVSAQGTKASKAAMRQLQGGAFTFIHAIQKELVDMLSGIEAALDFPDEVDEVQTVEEMAQRAAALSEKLNSACNERSARFLDAGMEVIIFGPPNVGKSSLFNALMMEERAIVTDIPGTTRDIVHGSILIDGLRINLSDTAGIHENAENIEKIGVERAIGAMHNADLLLVVVDGGSPLTREEHVLLGQTEDKPRILLQSKSDLSALPYLEDAILFSAHTGEGMDQVKAAIVKAAGDPLDSQLTLERHILLASQAAEALDEATTALQQGDSIELCAVHLQTALRTLGRITGDHVDEELLDAVFSNFCVGK